jgi:site-specific DNA recombinase
MLHCQWYVGQAYYNRTRTVRNLHSSNDTIGKKPPKETVTLRPQADWIPVAVPPIIDEELFARVQQRIRENHRFARRRLCREGVFLLRGLLKCGVCGHAYVAETHSEDRVHGGKYSYEYYICNMRMAPLAGAVRHRCPNDRLRAVGVDEAVWTAIRDLLLDSAEVTTRLRHWAEHTSTDSSELQSQLQRAERRLHELTRQRDRLLDAYQSGALSLDILRTRMQSLEESRLSAESAVDQIRAEQLTAEVARGRALGAETVIERLRPALLNADFATRQLILRLLIEHVVVHGQRLEVQLALPVSGNFDLTSKDPGA